MAKSTKNKRTAAKTTSARKPKVFPVPATPCQSIQSRSVGLFQVVSSMSL